MLFLLVIVVFLYIVFLLLNCKAYDDREGGSEVWNNSQNTAGRII